MTETTETTDLVVVGAGPGGYAAAFNAADRGLSVVLVDASARPGGVCLQRGCIPSKALLHAARVLTDARDAGRWGIEFGPPSIDLAALRSWKDQVVGRLTGGLGRLAAQRTVRYVQGRAALAGPHELTVTRDGAGGDPPRRIRFEHAVLATGSRPARPGPLALDDARVLDSTGALALERVPPSLLVVGGGYIGLELGTVYAALGSAVTVVEATSRLLPGVDADLVRVLARRFGRLAAAVHLDTSVTSLAAGPAGIDATLAGPSAPEAPQRFDAVLVAVGRVPNSDVPGLDRTRVERDGRGFVQVDAGQRTAEPSILAVGDVTGEPLLAHKAFHEARAAVDTITARDAARRPGVVPAVVFTDPEVAWCGLTEIEAAARGRTVATASFPWGASGRALTLDRPEGLTKLVLDPQTERILGVGIAGSGAGELIAEGVLAVERQATASDLAGAIHPHPTLSETLMEAADAFFGRSIHIPRPGA